MRRLNRFAAAARDDEHGAMAVTITVLLAALFLFTAVVVDSGRLFDERHQLQDGADAAVLALAYDCARDHVTCLIDPASRGQALIDANSKDGTSSFDPSSSLLVNPLIELDPLASSLGAAGTVTADLLVREPGQSVPDGEVTLSYQWPEGETGQPVRTRAIAMWAPVMRDRTLALTFSECEWDRGTLGGTSFGLLEITVYLHDGGTTDPCAGPAHGNAPGQFGWLDGVDCIAEISADARAPGDTGNDVPPECRELFHRSTPSLLGAEQLIPIFDGTTGSGNNTRYHIIGFGAMEITGWYLGGQYYAPASHNRCPPTSLTGRGAPSDLRCIRGRFIEFISLTGTPDPSAPDMGARSARLIG